MLKYITHSFSGVAELTQRQKKDFNCIHIIYYCRELNFVITKK